MQENMKEYFSEKEARERRLAIYTEKIQETVLNKSAETIRSLVDERHNQKMTQQEISDITGIKPSNLDRFESGGRVRIPGSDPMKLQEARNFLSSNNLYI